MIFVTVGTHEQPFNRLLEIVDNLRESNVITEEVNMQTGYSTYTPKYCQAKPFFTYDEMASSMKNARIVITHGGPSSFLMAVQYGKVPIVFPRLHKYGEHINDHQARFSEFFMQNVGGIVVAQDAKTLSNYIAGYSKIQKNLKTPEISHNQNFNQQFELMIDHLFE